MRELELVAAYGWLAGAVPGVFAGVALAAALAAPAVAQIDELRNHAGQPVHVVCHQAAVDGEGRPARPDRSAPQLHWRRRWVDAL